MVRNISEDKDKIDIRIGIYGPYCLPEFRIGSVPAYMRIRQYGEIHVRGVCKG